MPSTVEDNVSLGMVVREKQFMLKLKIKSQLEDVKAPFAT